MKIELNKEDLISLVIGTSPYYSAFDDKLVSECGYWTGGFVDKWTWYSYKLKELDEDQLIKLYEICKNSWKK